MRLFDDDLYWTIVKDGNEQVFEIFKRHYTYRQWRRRNGKNGKRIAGPGQHIVLLGKDNKAIFIWRVQLFRLDGQNGVECMVFRNEGNGISSELLRQAEEIAIRKWPGQRLYTFVNPKKIKSSNPGFCYKVNGWRQCGISKAKKLIILEKILPCVPGAP